ncbi:hypothetical protein niasHS_011048 [Heterodera schachtii]|uniref:BAH domain-containing protein n=1 Tax=Heterodera schachtii TaxID=97005 RepID=A0ABD2J0G1_HETSC
MKINNLFLLPRSRRSERTKNHRKSPQNCSTNRRSFAPLNQLCRYSVGPSRIRTKEEIWDGFRRFRAGDIVRIMDEDEGKGYFAQTVAFITDDYANQFAMVIWLLPKLNRNSFPKPFEFNADRFQHGFAEERPVPIKACEFISKCPPFPPYKRKWTPINQILAQKRSEITRRIEELKLK